MKNKKYCVAAGALLCSTALGVFSPALKTYAAFDNSADGSSYFDTNAQACIVDGYNAENGTSITSVEQIDPSKITTLDCSGRNIKNFKGVTILTSLKSLNISNNPNLLTNESSFLTPASLETINVSGVTSTYFDFSNSPALKTVTTDRDIYTKTTTYVEKLNDNDEYAYGMNLSGLKFLGTATPTIDETNYPAKYDSDTQTISYKDNIPGLVPVKVGSYTYNIFSRGGSMQSVFYFDDGEDEAPRISLIRDNCEEEAEDEDVYYICDNSVYYGDVIDTETFVKNYDFADYALSKVEIVPPTANVELTTNEDAVKKGIVLADANFTIKYYFDSDLATPNTGAFTAGGPTIVATTATLAIVLTGLGIYTSRYAAKRQQSKIRFGKK